MKSFGYLGGGGGHYEIGLFFRGGGGGAFLNILGLFFWTAKFQIFLGMPDIPDFFFLLFFLFWGGGGLNSRCWVQAYG